MKKRYISYLRVSTARQGASGLGIEAQRAAVTRFVDSTAAQIIQEFVEAESGRKCERRALSEALKTCRIMNATLVVAKVDRLTRSASFLLQLLDSGVEIEFCDLPQISGPTGRFLLNQMAAIAELEAALISQRTRDALAAAKKRGVKLGSPQNATSEGRKKGLERSLLSRKKAAEEFSKNIRPILLELRSKSYSLARVAEVMNERQIPTRFGFKWSASQVARILG